ncbi:MAG: multidrug ABC transporter substrate-binding protein [Planctomycetota bacterium]|nr:MAG: multidrug ABC transporter substrate-binding protein [Planctomycetota bacterium]
MYRRFMTLRYLRSRAISYVAIFVLALGVAVLLIVTAVMGGFQREFHEKIRSTISDVSVETRGFGLADAAALEAQLRALPHVKAAAPYLHSEVVIRSFRTWKPGVLRGIDPAKEVQVGKLADYLLSEREILELQVERHPELRSLMADVIARTPNRKPTVAEAFGPTRSGLPPLVVGGQLLVQLSMQLGDKVKLVAIAPAAAEGDPTQIRQEDVREMEFEVSGVIQSGWYDLDESITLTTIAAAQRFFDVGERHTGIALKLDDYQQAAAVAERIRREVDLPGLQVVPWFKRNQNLLEAVKTEQFLIYFIVFFLIVLAGLNLTSILTMSVVEKIKDLGILAALGATRRGIMSIFLWQGGLIAILGSALGVVFGLGFVAYINEIDRNVLAPLLGRRVFDPSIYYLQEIPSRVTPEMVVICVVPVVVLGFLLALYPAYRAARLDPLEALRYE